MSPAISYFFGLQEPFTQKEYYKFWSATLELIQNYFTSKLKYYSIFLQLQN